MYVCTRVVKRLVKDTFWDGPGRDWLTAKDEKVEVKADTLRDLVDELGFRYYLDIDHLSFNHDSLLHTRLENCLGAEPNEHEKREWKCGRISLWQAEYTFEVEKRVSEKVSIEDLLEEEVCV